MRNGAVDALVLDLDTRAGLAIARGLGRQGISLAVASREPRSSGLRTRYARTTLLLPAPEDDFEAYVEGIAAFLRSDGHPRLAVIPSTDWSVEALDRMRRREPGLGAPAIAAPEALARAGSKEETLRVAAELGLAQPRSLRAASAQEAREAALSLGLPVVLKPESSWRALGAGGERVGPVYVEDASALDAAAAQLVRGDAPVLVQEFATGARETVKLFRSDGRVRARLVMRVERTWPLLGGSSVMRSTIPPAPELVEPAERLVGELGLDGYAEVEFRRDRGGRPLLMEVNARLSQSVELALLAGVDFARMQFAWARGDDAGDVDGYRVGVRLGWLAGDLRILATALARRRVLLLPEIADVGRDYVLRHSRLDGVDLRDPRPMLGAALFVLSAGRSGRGG